MPQANLDEVRESIRHTQLAVLSGSNLPGANAGAGGGGGGGDLNPATTYNQSEGKAVQSVGQTTAIVIQDAADMLRNISTIEVTAIGAATAAWLADPANVSYEPIITAATKTINDAAAAYLTIGQNAYKVFSQFE